VLITNPLAGEIAVKASSSHLAKTQFETWYLIEIRWLSCPVPDFDAHSRPASLPSAGRVATLCDHGLHTTPAYFPVIVEL
jgi:hypothetical protein